MFLIEIGEPFFDFFAHGDGLLEVLVLRLEDVDAIVDDGALLEQLPLLSGRVLGQDRFGAPEDMGSAIDSAESEVSERAGKGTSHSEKVFRETPAASASCDLDIDLYFIHACF